MIHDKDESMKRERQDMPEVQRYLTTLFGCTFHETSIYDQKRGKDLISSDKESYEIKIRDTIYRDLYKIDILIETISNDKKDSPGWIYYSEADWLIYLYAPLDDLIGYKIKMPVLKKWWSFNEHRRVWMKKVVDNRGYNTINRVVPIKFLNDVKITYLPWEASGYKIE